MTNPNIDQNPNGNIEHNRVRIEVGTSVKGVKTWSATYEDYGTTIEEALAQSDKLVAALNERYPTVEA